MLRPGTEIAGKYRIERPLGAGGMGTVFEATHLSLRQRVALKVLPPDRQQRPGAAERFLREARAASRLRSQHVARVFDMGTSKEGLVYMALEYLEGEDLLQRLTRRGPFPVKEAISSILQVCEGLAEAHGAGLVHRDIKPGNLFHCRGPDGTPLIKILDFGITKEASTPQESVLTTSAALLGSPVYMAPEQFVDAHEVDARADIWSLGVVLYELLTGSLPFAASTVATLCRAIAAGEPAPPDRLRPDLPPHLTAVILRCLSKDPADRFPDVAALAQALAEHGTAEQQNAARRCARILREGLRASAPPPEAFAPLESWPATALDQTGFDAVHTHDEKDAARSIAWAGLLMAVGLSAGLVIWMTRLVARPSVEPVVDGRPTAALSTAVLSPEGVARAGDDEGAQELDEARGAGAGPAPVPMREDLEVWILRGTAEEAPIEGDGAEADAEREPETAPAPPGERTEASPKLLRGTAGDGSALPASAAPSSASPPNPQTSKPSLQNSSGPAPTESASASAAFRSTPTSAPLGITPSSASAIGTPGTATPAKVSTSTLDRKLTRVRTLDPSPYEELPEGER